MSRWTTEQSADLYLVEKWGKPYVHVSERGRVEIHPDATADDPGPGVDLYELVAQIRRRGVSTPLLLRFDGLLRARVRDLNRAFANAREEYDYPAPYRGVFPIKVNQERSVVETLMSEGRRFGMGLEVGSKPELIAGIALEAGEHALMICNGYKDAEYVETAMLSSKLGITPIIVVEKFTELGTILEAARKLEIRPRIGVRCKLSFRSSGRWQDSVGDRSKFGLTTREVVRLVETLREEGMLDCLELLHFHIGSQITHIRSIKHAMREATNILVGLTRLGAEIRWFDAGGGLGVDYDGSRTDFESSKNYSLQEYANDVVYALAEAVRENGITAPTIVTESGRALVAHHAVLVAETVGVTTFEPSDEVAPVTEDTNEVVRSMAELAATVTPRKYLEVYHDALDLREQAMLLFNTGQLGLDERAQVEEHFWRACRAVLSTARKVDYAPEDLDDLERALADTMFLNMSVFQSIPDAWAIGQMFPVMPIQRLDEEPRRRTVLADLTCDSDGKIQRFIDLRGVKHTLEVHGQEPDEPYFMAFFLVGAYQEILGDMHNLFGDTNTVHVDLDEAGRSKLTHVIRGDRVREVLEYVDYSEADLLRQLRGHVEDALHAGRLTYEESALFWRRYEDALASYTYLRPSAPARKRDTLVPATPLPDGPLPEAALGTPPLPLDAPPEAGESAPRNPTAPTPS
ncbi:MAG: biosynthetic arginine decarboxylase [Planctomycetota bacterium]|jgi:arginine decarboxylase